MIENVSRKIWVRKFFLPRYRLSFPDIKKHRLFYITNDIDDRTQHPTALDNQKQTKKRMFVFIHAFFIVWAHEKRCFYTLRN